MICNFFIGKDSSRKYYMATL